jgi:hypothetical protein
VPNVIKVGVPVLGLALHCITLSVPFIKLSHKNFQYSWWEDLAKLLFRNNLLHVDVLYVFFLCVMDEGVVLV